MIKWAVVQKGAMNTFDQTLCDTKREALEVLSKCDEFDLAANKHPTCYLVKVTVERVR